VRRGIQSLCGPADGPHYWAVPIRDRRKGAGGVGSLPTNDFPLASAGAVGLGKADP
jgi:hypothetical protein